MTTQGHQVQYDELMKSCQGISSQSYSLRILLVSHGRDGKVLLWDVLIYTYIWSNLPCSQFPWNIFFLWWLGLLTAATCSLFWENHNSPTLQEMYSWFPLSSLTHTFSSANPPGHSVCSWFLCSGFNSQHGEGWSKNMAPAHKQGPYLS